MLRWCLLVLSLTLLLVACAPEEGSVSVSSSDAEADSVGFVSAREAALAAARLTYPVETLEAVDPGIVVYVDSEMIDLLVRVEDGAFCRWYGVSGLVEEGRVVYRAGPAVRCVDA